MRKRLYLLSLLLLTVCGQMWADYDDGKPDHGTRCNGNSPTKTVIVDGVMYSLYSNQNYIYTYEYHTSSTSWSSNYAVAVYAESGDARTELTIKSTVQDGGTTYTVVAIGEQFFWYNNTATKLTIPATVRTLETFALENNTSNLREIVIEDSWDKLECFRTSKSYGAFSWNGGLKKVYIGRKLYPVGNSDDYAPFYKGDFTDLEVTFGPLVDYIYGYTFYNNSIKSIKAMPTLPPNWAAYAFGGVSSNIPVYVSYKAIDAYKAHSGWSNFTNYVLDTELCKTDALNDLDAEAGENPSDAIKGIVSDYKDKINNAVSGADVVTNLNAGKLAIQLQKAKETAIAALNTEAGNAPSQTVANVRDTWIANVNKATTVDDVNTQKENGIAAIQLQKAKDAAIAALNTEAGNSPSEAVANVRDTWITNVNNAGTITDVETQKNNGIAAIQLQKAKDAAIAALNTEAGNSPSEAVAGVRDTWIANVNNAGTIADVNTQRDNGIAAIRLQIAKETAIAELNATAETNPSDAAAGIVSTYTDRINAATTTDGVTSEKEAGIQALADAKALQDAKTTAFSALMAEAGQSPSEEVAKVRDTWIANVNKAGTIADVNTQRDNGIAAIRLQIAKETAIAALNATAETNPSDAAAGIVSTYTGRINAATTTDVVTSEKDEGVQALKDANELQDAKTTAIAALNEAKITYPSDAADAIVSTYTDRINAAATTDGVTSEKNEGIQALQNAYAEQIALQNAKTEAIAALSTAAGTYPSDAADAIVSTYTDRINEATTPDAVNAARNEGVQALQDAHDAQKETERLAALDAVTVTQTADDDFSYLLEEGVAFTFAGDNVSMTVNGVAATGFTLSATDAITVCPARTFTVIANEDPDNKGKCYSTFYTSEGAYKVPATAKAYTGEVEGDDVLKLKNVGSIIHAKEAVILRASESNLLLMPSCCTVAASPDNNLQGSDVPMTMPANSYALSYGQDGVCFYDFSGRELPANKAFLLLDAAAHSNGLRFVFDDATDIDTPVIDAPANAYNLQGQQVDETYRGIVIINGKKVLKR